MRENVKMSYVMKEYSSVPKRNAIQINVQVGEFHRNNKRALLNKHAGETSCKKIFKCAGLK